MNGNTKKWEEYHQIWIILIIMAMARISCPIGLLSVPECETQHLLIYNNPSQSLIQTQTNNFTITFLKSYSSEPMVVLGLGGYTSNDLFRLQYWSMTQQLINNNSAIVLRMRVQNSTAIWKLYINYIAADLTAVTPGLFTFYTRIYESSQLVNTSVNTGTRTDTLVYRPTPIILYPTSSFVFCFTKTFYMNSSTSSSFDFGVSCTLNIQTNATGQNIASSARIVISAFDNIKFMKLGFGIMFVNPSIISTDNYFRTYIGSVSLTSTLSSVDYSSLNIGFGSTSISIIPISDISSANFLNLFSSFGTSTSVVINFGWDIIASSSGTILRITNPNGHRALYYKYLIFGRVNCTGSYWSITSQQCVANCTGTQTHKTNDNICRVCVSPCQSCSGVPTNCTTCVNGYFLYNNTCTNCTASFWSTSLQQCVVACSATETHGTTDNICVPCTQPCLACSISPTNCTSCISTHHLINYTCTDCPTSFWSTSLSQCVIACSATETHGNTDNVCVACTEPCLACNGSSTNCTSCISTYHLSNNVCTDCPTSFWSPSRQQCVSACASSQTHAIGDNICIACTPPCHTCTNTPTNCSSCSSSQILYNSNCVNCSYAQTHQIQYLLSNCQEIQNPISVSTPPYWLFALLIFPILAIIAFCYYKRRKSKQIVNMEKIPAFRQHPSIQL